MLHDFTHTPSLIQQYVKELRDINIQNDRLRFRHNLERIGMLLAYEVSKTLAYAASPTDTPLGIADCQVLAPQPVVGTILRAGLPMHEGALRAFDGADNAFVSAYRKHHKSGAFEINLEYVSTPAFAERPLIMCDPMLATGASMVQAVQAIRQHGEPSSVHIIVAIAARDGIEHVQRRLPEAHIWAAAVDEELTAKSYIVPGLGDAGDLAYGSKAQD